MVIDISDTTNELSDEELALIEQLVRFIAKAESVPNHAEISVNFVDDVAIQALNLQYRNKNEPTDVISFAMQESISQELQIQTDDSFPLMLGDIVISVDRANNQAKTYNHSFKREICFLTMHGFLHLLGYDHLRSTDEKVMFARQHELLRDFGIERA